MIEELIENLNKFKDKSKFDSFAVMFDDLYYDNEYVKVIRVDSSNKWEGVPHKSNMNKQWGIIIDKKKDFTDLDNYVKLSELIDIKLTEVKKGVNKGKFGIRIYNMSQNPNKEIVKQLLRFIFK